MADTTNLMDLGNIWSTVKSLTSSSDDGKLSISNIKNVIKEVVSNYIGKQTDDKETNKSATTPGSVPWGEIGTTLLSLYNKYKGSDDDAEVKTAQNVKTISNVFSTISKYFSSEQAADNDSNSALGGLISGFLDTKDGNGMLKDNLKGAFGALFDNDKEEAADEENPLLSRFIETAANQDNDNVDIAGVLGSLLNKDGDDDDNESSTAETLSKGLNMLGGLFK
jgi:hypothetical protein